MINTLEMKTTFTPNNLDKIIKSYFAKDNMKVLDIVYRVSKKTLGQQMNSYEETTFDFVEVKLKSSDNISSDFEFSTKLNLKSLTNIIEVSLNDIGYEVLDSKVLCTNNISSAVYGASSSNHFNAIELDIKKIEESV